MAVFEATNVDLSLPLTGQVRQFPINKQIIIQPKVARNHLAKFVKNLEDEGIRMIFVDPKSLGKTKIQTVFASQNASAHVVHLSFILDTITILVLNLNG